jgi:hypothetical protein
MNASFHRPPFPPAASQKPLRRPGDEKSLFVSMRPSQPKNVEGEALTLPIASVDQIVRFRFTGCVNAEK